MNNKLYFYLLLLVLLFIVPLERGFATENVVSVYDAEKVIEEHIKNFEPGEEYYGLFDNATIILERNLYDTDDTLIAYYFKLKKNDKAVGYYIISATKLITPVLEYQGGTAGHEGFEKIPKEEKIYYFGGVEFTSSSNSIELPEKFNKSINMYQDSIKQQINQANINSVIYSSTKKSLEEEFNKSNSITLDDLRIKRESSNIQTWSNYLENNISKENQLYTTSQNTREFIRGMNGVRQGGVAFCHVNSRHIEVLNNCSLNLFKRMYVK